MCLSLCTYDNSKGLENSLGLASRALHEIVHVEGGLIPTLQFKVSMADVSVTRPPRSEVRACVLRKPGKSHWMFPALIPRCKILDAILFFLSEPHAQILRQALL